MTLFLGLPRWAGTRKIKPIWILLKQETVSGSGISWAICKSVPCSRQTTTPAPTTLFFTGQMPFLPPNQHKALTIRTTLSTSQIHKRETYSTSRGEMMSDCRRERAKWWISVHSDEQYLRSVSRISRAARLLSTAPRQSKLNHAEVLRTYSNNSNNLCGNAEKFCWLQQQSSRCVHSSASEVVTL